MLWCVFCPSVDHSAPAVVIVFFIFDLLLTPYTAPFREPIELRRHKRHKWPKKVLAIAEAFH